MENSPRNKMIRGQDPKIAMGLGIKEEKGYNISHIKDPKVILPGIKPDDIYKITHYGSQSVVGFCSGKKAMKVLISLMKKGGFKDYYQKWLWDPRIAYYANKSEPIPEGGFLQYHYSSDGKFWVDADNTQGYYFTKGNGLIMEL
jgi:hypothetical protein